MPQPLLAVTDLTKSYRDGSAVHAILRGINLTVHPGESIAIIGRSGCGKTTLLNLIAGLDLPDSGSVFIEQQNLTGLNDKQRTLLRRSRIGFVFQFFNLLPTLTVLENILLPMVLSGLPHGREVVMQHLRAVGLAGFCDRFPEQLSGGELQRVAILRALAHRPQLLLADEPSGNLDHETGEQIAEILFGTVTAGSALIVVTHSTELAARADRIYQLQDGLLSPADRHV